jgi:tyrosyl-tRNA synthetase
MFTFLPIEECEALSAPGKNPNEAKERLAWEVTALIHGKDEADKALAGAQAAFGKGAAAGDRSALPTAEMSREKFESGYGAIDLFFDAGLCATKSDARRLIQQGGAFIAEKAVKDVKASVGAEVLDDAGEVVLRAGKKRYLLIKAL